MKAIIKKPIAKNKAKNAAPLKNVDNSAVKKYTVKTVKKELVVSDGQNLNLRLIVDKKRISLLPSSQAEFVFQSQNNTETIKRWQMVIDGMQAAVNALAKERKI